MFPLGSVLLPGALLPLHVFEPRYRALVQDCMEADGRFGVVLIERGHEVGGGDVRTAAGTLAEIIDVRPLGGGRLSLVAVGRERIEARRWLPDDPYPRAEVQPWRDLEPGADLGPVIARVIAAIERVAGLRQRLGSGPSLGEVPWSPDPVAVSYQLAAVAGLGPFDQQRLLCAEGPEERLAVLSSLLRDEEQTLQARLDWGGSGT